MKKSLHIIDISESLRKAFYNTFLLNTLPERPENAVVLRNKLASADGPAIVSPEYNYSTMGGLKKRSAGLSRGEDSPLLELPVQLSFQPIFQYPNMKILVTNAKAKFDDKRKLIGEQTKTV